MKLLDSIILSSIFSAKNNGTYCDIWKFNSISFFSFSTSSFILTIGMIIEHWYYKPMFSVFFLGNLIPHNVVGFLIQWTVFLLLPIFVLTYKIYIHDNRYKKVENNHPYASSSKTPFAIYVILSIASPIFLIYLKSKF